ncbi:LysR substrate-binding domain-containing protein [Pseudomonas brassicacearum]|uniref:LysR substrate-binding domain-containing protein n=1 Tax=Pseudomonas brassicacearum TaxID=930166 RepID=UPI000F49DD64|nr:LysR substrate-binding domain-containing protein [Pseudomonas brassicacearum]
MLAPVDLLHDTLTCGRLVRVLREYELSSRTMHLLFSPDRRQTPKLRSFIDSAAEHFSPEFAPPPNQWWGTSAASRKTS